MEWLGIQENPQGKGWAAGAGYGEKILVILNSIVGMSDISGAEGSGLVSKTPVPYQVRVMATDLNIRTGPGTNYTKTGRYTGKGIFTIVEESPGEGSSKGWGKLKSGAGWISLDIASKI